MKNFIKGCLLALAVWAGPAHALTYQVNSNLTMGTTNTAAVAGDLVMVAAGTYTTLPNPTNSGTSYANLITYRASGAVVYSGNINASTDLFRIVGGTVTGNFHCTSSADNVWGDSLAVGGTVEMSGAAGCKVSNGTVGDGWAFDSPFAGSGYPFETITDYCHHDTLQNINATFTATSANSAGLKTVAVCGGFYAHSLMFDRVHLSMTINCSGVNQDFQPHEYYWVRNSVWNNCYFKVINNAGDHPGSCPSANVKVSFGLRDSAMFNTFDTDTFWTAAGTAPSSRHLLSNSGTLNNTYYNTFNKCVFWNETDDGATVAGNAKGLKLQFSILGSTDGPALSDNGDAYPDSAIVRHNTFVSTQRRALTFGDGTIIAGKFNQNIIYGTGSLASSCGGEGSVLMKLQGDPGGANDYGDSNLVYCAPSPTLTGSASAKSSGCRSWPYDATWKWNSPFFADSTLTFASFDGHTLAGSFALNTTWGASPFADGFAGALGVATADVTAPATIADLAVTAVGTGTVTLQWTAPGDDGSTGTATSYDLRYRTVGAVTDGNFGAATQATGEPTPALAGTVQSMTVSGLTGAVPLWFGLKTSDEVPNTSATSNSPTGTPNLAATTAIVLGGIELVPTFNNIGVRLWYTGDDDYDATARIFYRVQNSGAVRDSGMVMDTVKVQNCFAGSVLWLTQNTTYDVVVRVSDPDGVTGVDSVEASTLTLTTPTSLFFNTRIYCDYQSGDDSNPGNIDLPVKHMQVGWAMVPNNGALVLKAGSHYDSLEISDTGGSETTLRKYLIGLPGARVDGSDEDKLSMTWTLVSVGGINIYYKTGFAEYYTRLVCADSTGRLFRHPTKKSLLNDSLGATVAGGWYQNLDTMWVQLDDGSDPTGHVMHFAKRTHLVTVQASNIGIENIDFRYGGSAFADNTYLNSGISQGVLQIYSSQNVHVRNCRFYNNGWDAISADSLAGNGGNRNILIEDNRIWDTDVCLWASAATDNTIQHHPNIFFRSGRQIVIRRNTVDCSKDGGVRCDETTQNVASDIDIHNNTITRMAGNAIELDAIAAPNTRVYLNRVVNDVNGNAMDLNIIQGPLYLLYNTFIGFGSIDAITTHSNNGSAATDSNNVGRMYAYHNTIFSTVSGASAYGLNGVRKGDVWMNNILGGKATVAIDDYSNARLYKDPANQFNWNLYYVPGSTTFFKAHGSTYNISDSTTFRTNNNWEKNGRIVTTLIFADTTADNYALLNDLNAVNRGRRIPGINTLTFGGIPVLYNGSAPDFGASEFVATSANPHRRRRWLKWWPF